MSVTVAAISAKGSRSSRHCAIACFHTLLCSNLKFDEVMTGTVTTQLITHVKQKKAALQAKVTCHGHVTWSFCNLNCNMERSCPT